MYIHNKILNTSEKDIPKLPPKIENRSPELLEQRMYQLEEYLNAYLIRYPINPLILEFWEFSNTGSPIFRELTHMNIRSIDVTIPGKYYRLTETGTVDTYYEALIQIFPQEDQNPMQVKIQLTYDILKQFHSELKLIARMGDIDIRSIGDIPSTLKPNGEKYIDQEMMENIEEYLSRFQNNPSLLNLILFKKFIADNIIIDGHFEGDEKRKSENRRVNLLGSIRNENDMFNGIDYRQQDDDSEEDEL